MPTLHANTTLVASAWLGTLGLAAGIGTTLPPVAKWATTGFVVVGPVVGSAPNMYLAERHPIVQIDCYATFASSEKVNRGMANDLAETIYNGALIDPAPVVAMRAGIAPVWLSSTYPLTEPREIPEPDTNFGRYSIDVHIGWIEQTIVIG